MKPFTEKELELLSEFRRSKTIGVLMGGPSEERDISLKSGAAVLTHLSSSEYRVEPFDFKTEEELRKQLQTKKIDVAFLALHGRYGEDGEVQSFLESLDIPYTGSPASASRLAFNKWVARLWFRRYSLLTPDAFVVRPSDPLPPLTSFPVIVKPVHQGSSLGLRIVDDQKALAQAVEEAFAFDHRILIEEYIPGSEFTVGILGEEALPVIQILPAGRCYDYDSKYISDRTQFLIPAPLKESLIHSLQGSALTAHEALGCRSFSRVDFILNRKEEPVILEVNTIPGLTARSLLPRACEAAGLSFLELCEKMIVMAAHRRVRGIYA